MRRRSLLQAGAALAGLAGLRSLPALSASGRQGSALLTRVRPTDPEWPTLHAWQALKDRVGGRLIRLSSPLDACAGDGAGADCSEAFRLLRNPYHLRDTPGLTQSLGWVDAWTSRPSVYAVAAESAADVAAAVDFARHHRLRLVVKGAGHSYQGTSCAPDSLLVWMRRMETVTLHDDFVPVGCAGSRTPRPAVSVGGGAIWGPVYKAVADAGRYVQGGGCLTVGVAGLVQSGGFGPFSKGFGTAAASLLEAEIVTADGRIRTVNACSDPDLFWALKGGGGGSFGVVTRMTLATHPMPKFMGGAFFNIHARSDIAFRRLLGRMLAYYADGLLGPHWGEQIGFQPNNVMTVAMTFQGLDQAKAEAAWKPFLEEIAATPAELVLESEPFIKALPADRFWDPAFLKTIPGLVLEDDRPGASPDAVYWAGNREEAGQVLHGYRSTWLPVGLLSPAKREALADAMFAASRRWRISLHCNKGLAGATADTIEATRDTAMNPAVLDAFGLLICGAGGEPAYPGILGREPDVATARIRRARVDAAMAEVIALLTETSDGAPGVPGSYVSESDFFERRWSDAFWGAHYARLRATKDRYDPNGLFFVHHGVGSEDWSPDGFTRIG